MSVSPEVGLTEGEEIPPVQPSPKQHGCYLQFAGHSAAYFRLRKEAFEKLQQLGKTTPETSDTPEATKAAVVGLATHWVIKEGNVDIFTLYDRIDSLVIEELTEEEKQNPALLEKNRTAKLMLGQAYVEGLAKIGNATGLFANLADARACSVVDPQNTVTPTPTTETVPAPNRVVAWITQKATRFAY